MRFRWEKEVGLWVCGKIAIVSLAVAEKQLLPAVDLATLLRPQ